MRHAINQGMTYQVQDLDPTDTVAVLKQKILDQHGILVEEQVLTHGGPILVHEKTLADYNITER